MFMDNTIENCITAPDLKETDTRAKIRVRFIKGMEIKEIIEDLGIPEGTWDSSYWRNTHGLRDFVAEIKKERSLKLVENVSNNILTMDTTENPRMLAIKQKEAEFIRETLLKDHGYTKRSEVIGLNINKTEPLDEEQKKKLDTILNK